jgi:hypothetical protein
LWYLHWFVLFFLVHSLNRCQFGSVEFVWCTTTADTGDTGDICRVSFHHSHAGRRSILSAFIVSTVGATRFTVAGSARSYWFFLYFLVHCLDRCHFGPVEFVRCATASDTGDTCRFCFSFHHSHACRRRIPLLLMKTQRHGLLLQCQ